MKPKYNISMKDLETHGGIEKLKKDNHTNEAIHKALYQLTDGATQRQREEIISKLYDRKG